MIITFALVFLALLVLLFLVRLAKGRIFSSRRREDTNTRIQTIDIQAFRNLIDPAEAEFLRGHLSPSEFRTLQRERLRAAVSYISCAAANAAVLVQVGESARRSSDPAVAQAGDNLVSSAIRLRFYALRAISRLYLGIIFPASDISTAGLAESYERMTRTVFQLTRLQKVGRESLAS